MDEITKCFDSLGNFEQCIYAMQKDIQSINAHIENMSAKMWQVDEQISKLQLKEELTDLRARSMREN